MRLRGHRGRRALRGPSDGTRRGLQGIRRCPRSRARRVPARRGARRRVHREPRQPEAGIHCRAFHHLRHGACGRRGGRPVHAAHHRVAPLRAGRGPDGRGPGAGRDAEPAGGPHGALRLQLRDGRDHGRGDPRRAVAVAPHRTRAQRPARDGAPRAAPGGHGPRPGHRYSPPTTCPRRTPLSNARRRAGPWRCRSFPASNRRPRRPR